MGTTTTTAAHGALDWAAKYGLIAGRDHLAWWGERLPATVKADLATNVRLTGSEKSTADRNVCSEISVQVMKLAAMDHAAREATVTAETLTTIAAEINADPEA